MTSTDLGAALEAFIHEHEYCGELDAGVEESRLDDVHMRGGDRPGIGTCGP